MYKAEYGNIDGEFITVKQGSQLTNLSMNTVRKIAEEAGAIRKIGRSCRINRNTFLSYINMQFRK